MKTGKQLKTLVREAGYEITEYNPNGVKLWDKIDLNNGLMLLFKKTQGHEKNYGDYEYSIETPDRTKIFERDWVQDKYDLIEILKRSRNF